jgi:hypothetical protein
VTILALREGRFGYVDVLGEHLEGEKRLTSERCGRRGSLVASMIVDALVIRMRYVMAGDARRLGAVRLAFTEYRAAPLFSERCRLVAS